MKHLSAGIPLVFCAFMFSACATSSADDPRLIPMVEDHPAVRQTPAWLNPKTLEVHSRQIKPEDNDMILWGTLTGWRFSSDGPIQGTLHSPPPNAATTPAFLILMDRSLHAGVDAGVPSGAHLVGVMDPKTGLFYPTSAAVQNTPITAE